MQQELEISTSLMSHLARRQTVPCFFELGRPTVTVLRVSLHIMTHKLVMNQRWNKLGGKLKPIQKDR